MVVYLAGIFTGVLIGAVIIGLLRGGNPPDLTEEQKQMRMMAESLQK